ncbi:hypothetical protein FNT36_12160 [Hymenobacter setariae]|uniref:T9SS C-terminal target domain-containing protein n=1 Tax=Hymenobacter setariae TaxID=2594794 RepID=A0A558BUN9_9BACT|nr:hypothetical protein [Hymenobacter setariae]TVT40236.1 hypothetical protein FNT36_12160 [Hymenobacter setariae]
MKITFTIGFVLLLAGSLRAQTATTYVTEIITDYNGYWRSGTGLNLNALLNPTLPDNSQQLLAFTLNGKRFSTGVNNQLLTAKGVEYTPGQYQALPVAALSSTFTGNTKVALGQLFDKVDNGPSTPPPANDFAQYLTDGVQGLDLGTGVANLPAGTLTFALNSVVPAAIGDGTPDVLVTQIASPDDLGDQYQFLDADGKTVGQPLTIVFTDVPVVGNWTVDFYEASQTVMSLLSNFTKTPRPLRLWAADFSAFNIVPSDYSRIKSFQIKLSGSSDQAFVAYNAKALSVTPLPVTLTTFTGEAQGPAVRLHWQTASERDAEAFVVEVSTDGSTFAPVGRVAAAGTTAQAQHYAFNYQPPQSGLVYYRLRQVDLDGTSHYSPVVAVRTGAAAVVVFPSVFDQALTVRLPAAGTTTLALLAPDGRVLHQQQLAESPAQDLALPGLAALPPGLYLLRVVLDGQASLHRVVKY